MKKTIWAALVFALLLATSASAQTVSYTLAWDHAVAPAVVATYTFTMNDNNGSPAVVATPVCVVIPAGSHCTSPLPAAMLPLAAVPHSFVLSATNATGTTKSDPVVYTPPGLPDKPTNGKFTFTISVP